MRYWSGTELDALVSEAAAAAGVQIRARALTDRSMLVGRHMDTGEFGSAGRPLRLAVNRLFEFNCRTDVAALHFELALQPNNSELCAFFTHL